MSESDLQKSICDYLDLVKIHYLRLNSGDMLKSYTPRGQSNPKTYRIKGCPKGTADLLVLASKKGSELELLTEEPITCEILEKIFPRPIFLECKSEKGKQTPEQKQFESIVKGSGYEYEVVRSLDDVIEILG